MESIAGINRDTYDRTKVSDNTENFAQTLEARATSVFSQQDSSEIFASLGGNKEDTLMLQKYIEVSNLATFDERRNIFSNVSALERSNFWKVQLAYSLVKFPDLNFEQNEVIIDALSLITPELFEMTTPSKNSQDSMQPAIKTISDRIYVTFPKEKGLEIFLKFGGESSAESLAGNCDCSRGSIPACWTEYCPSSSCSRTRSGCGVFWLFSCDGKC
ncbi:MAG: bacteriocin fulvocin C-related protein [Pyrinomonadaceae bacterium]|nr:bacteriocin fulvocin C-related protein [Pyrinomonadaceae bacterium]